MKRSTERILTTHVGSLPRPPDLLDMVQAKGRALDAQHDAARLRAAVSEIVRKQIELGIDVIDDGEFGKPSFVTYVNERLGGFELDADAPPRTPWTGSREALAFPEFYARGHVGVAPAPHGLHRPDHLPGPRAAQARHRQSQGGAQRRAGRRTCSCRRSRRRTSRTGRRNAYYKTQEEYLFAIAEAMREEYQAIVDAGFLVQIDDPRLVTYYMIRPEATIEDCRKWARGAGRGAQPCAARHPERENPPSHLLRHQHGPARARHGAQGT